MNTREWLSERVARLRKPSPAAARSTQERLKARLRQGEEAMSPSALRRKLDELKAIVDPLVSEVEGGKRAGVLIEWYVGATPAHRRDLWLLMSERFAADPQQVKTAQEQYLKAVGTPDEAAAEVLYRRATVPPRRSVCPG